MYVMPYLVSAISEYFVLRNETRYADSATLLSTLAWNKVLSCYLSLMIYDFFNHLKLNPMLNFRPYSCLFCCAYTSGCGPGSSVGIATDYGLDGPGSNPGGDEVFRPSRPALGPTQLPVQWVPGLSRG